MHDIACYVTLLIDRVAKGCFEKAKIAKDFPFVTNYTLNQYSNYKVWSSKEPSGENDELEFAGRYFICDVDMCNSCRGECVLGPTAKCLSGGPQILFLLYSKSGN